MKPQDVFRDRLRFHRDQRGWSQARLADEVSKRGGVMTQTTVTRLERGPREVTLDELLSLAGALGVSPLALLLPDDSGSEVKVDNETLTGRQLAGWYLGDPALYDRPGVTLPAALVESVAFRTPMVLRVLSELEKDGTDKQQLMLDAAARAEWLTRKHWRK